MRLRSEKGLILIDVLIVILIAGIIAAIMVPQYSQKKLEEQRTISRVSMITLADAQDTYFDSTGTYAHDLVKLSTIVQGMSNIVPPGGEAYIFEIEDSVSCLIIDPFGHGEVKSDTTNERIVSWEK